MRFKWLLKIFGALTILSTLPYYAGRIYSFGEPSAFEGEVFYNPYAESDSLWIKANFHAHSLAWLGLTNGKNSPEEMLAAYDSLGYGLPCLSNYNLIHRPGEEHFFLTAYEHGTNMGSRHQLVINDNEVNYFDFPLFQFLSHKQGMINKLKKNDNLVILAHPSYGIGYNENDFRFLENYDLVEILSINASSLGHWDEALSTGHAVWAVGNDDAHSVKESENGVCWTTINTDSMNEESVLGSLRRGSFYATRGWRAQEMNGLKKVIIENGYYLLELQRPADSVILKSDFGKPVASFVKTDKASYEILPENTYIRAEIYETEPWNNYTRMYLNPVIRTKNGELTKQRINNINTGLTAVYLLALALFHGIILWFLWKL